MSDEIRARCIGFGEEEGKCDNFRSERSPFWCDACEDARRVYVREQLVKLKEGRI